LQNPFYSALDFFQIFRTKQTAAIATRIPFVPHRHPRADSRGDGRIGKGWAEASLGTHCIRGRGDLRRLAAAGTVCGCDLVVTPADSEATLP